MFCRKHWKSFCNLEQHDKNKWKLTEDGRGGLLWGTSAADSTDRSVGRCVNGHILFLALVIALVGF